MDLNLSAEPVEVEIKGLRFKIEFLPYELADRYFYDLKKALAPLIIKAVSDSGSVKDLMNVGGDKLADLLRGANDLLTNEFVNKFAEELYKLVSVQDRGNRWLPLSNQAVRTQLFTGRIVLRHLILIECLKVQYADFLALFREKMPAQQADPFSPRI